jgi:DNA polymerase-3 subunit gamma/tau
LPVLRSFAAVVALAGARREAKLKVHLEEHVSLVKFEPEGRIELHLLPGAPKELGNELREKLNAWSGKRWMVALSGTPGERTLGEVARERAAAEIREMQKHPAVAAVLQQFPDAQITGVRPLPGTDKDETGTG